METRTRVNPAQDLYFFWRFLKEYPEQGNMVSDALVEYFEIDRKADLYARVMEIADLPRQIREILVDTTDEETAATQCDWWIQESSQFFEYFHLSNSVEGVMAYVSEHVMHGVFGCSTAITVLPSSDLAVRDALRKLSEFRDRIEADEDLESKLRLQLISGIRRLERLVIAHAHKKDPVVIAPIWAEVYVTIDHLNKLAEGTEYVETFGELFGSVTELVKTGKELGDAAMKLLGS